MFLLSQGIIIFFYSVYTFLPSFKLGLFGDDWVMLWIYMNHFGPHIQTSIFNYFTFFLSGYGPYEITMGLLYNLFGLNSIAYYTVSFFFRLLATFAIWPLIYYVTHSKLAAFYGTLFLSITTIGLETTNWVFNMTSYLAITFFSIFVYLFIKSRNELNFSLFLISSACFYLAHIFAPIRMTGLLPFTILLEIFLSRVHPHKNKLSFFRIIIIIIIFTVITTTGAITETQGRLINGAFGVITSGIIKTISLVKEGDLVVLFNPIITIGKMIVPDSFFSNTVNQKNIFLIIGLLIVSISMLLFKNARNINLKTSIFIALSWIFFSFIFSWFRDPNVLHPTDFRYFIPTAVGFSIFFASLIAYSNNSKKRVIVFVLLLVIVIFHTVSTRNFLYNEVINAHGNDEINRLLKIMPTEKNFNNLNGPLVYYFKSAPKKDRLIYYGIQFGLPYRLAFLNNMFDADAYSRMPVTMGEWKEVISSVTDGKSLVPRGHPEKKVPIENVYAFYLDENSNLINITEATRSELLSITSQDL